jgi:hypothetical protein
MPTLLLQGNRLVTWAKIDDGFHDHPKIVGLDLQAVGLWVKALSYCSRHLTDGLVPTSMVVHLAGLPRAQAIALARALVTAKLWEPVGAKGYRFHDYLTYQTSKQDVDKVRDDKRRAGRLGAQSRWQSDSSRHDSAASTKMASSSPLRSSPSGTEVSAQSPTVGDGAPRGSDVALAPSRTKPRTEPRATAPPRQYTGRPTSGEYETLRDALRETRPDLSNEQLDDLAIKHYHALLAQPNGQLRPTSNPQDAPAS